MVSGALVKYVLMAALRDKMIMTLLVALVVGACLGIFLGSAAVIEKDQFSVVFTASGLRLLSVFSLVLFVIFFVRRSFENKDIEFLLSRPVGRLSLLLSYSVAFACLSVLIGGAMILPLYAVAPHLLSYGHGIWILSLIVENIIMVNAALFFAMYISSAATASIVTMGFYVLSRMMGQLLGIVDSSLVDSAGPYSMALQLVSVFTPRLDLLGQSGWLIYGVQETQDIWFVILQGAVFSFLVFCAAMLDLVKRQF